VTPFTNINFTLSLSSDSLTGPYTTNFTVNASIPFTITVNQWTAGPQSTVTVSFGDGSATQSFNLMSSSVNITYNYTTAGTYTITANPVLTSLTGVNVTMSNTLTVVVLPPPVYRRKTNILFYLSLYFFHNY
jgi:hypothetical protein